MNVKLPKEIAVIDYHEFDSVGDYLRQIGLKVKVEEVGFNYHTGKYIGMIFEKKTAEVKKAINALRKKLKATECE